jgi:hypothetical protein
MLKFLITVAVPVAVLFAIFWCLYAPMRKRERAEAVRMFRAKAQAIADEACMRAEFGIWKELRLHKGAAPEELIDRKTAHLAEIRAMHHNHNEPDLVAARQCVLAWLGGAGFGKQEAVHA